MGWMAPLCIATGNTFVLKAASFVPQAAMRIAELWVEAGLPPGVLNIVTAGRNEAEILLEHPDIVGVSFVGSTKIGRHIYATAAANGKRFSPAKSLVKVTQSQGLLPAARPAAAGGRGPPASLSPSATALWG